jgi:PIN domain nuclease of toxin-antitoxin system
VRLLLDTHIFLWFVTGDRQLPVNLRDLIRDPANAVYLSAVSTWETIIKWQIGKLPLPGPPDLYLPKQRRLHQIPSLDVDEATVLHLAQLPLLHRDPFDRLLICQAIQHGLTLATVDTSIQAYPVATIG